MDAVRPDPTVDSGIVSRFKGILAAQHKDFLTWLRKHLH